MKKINFIILFLSLLSFNLLAQKNRFESEIRSFEKQDSIKLPSEGANLFVGSSSIRFWKTLQQDFPDNQVINRGFGGSNLVELAFLSERIITKYNPSKIFIYAGENDINDGVLAEEVLERLKIVVEKIRQKSNAAIVFISIKPSVARASQIKVQNKANKLIRRYMRKIENGEFVSIVKEMQIKKAPNESLFVKDMLHMNALGYQIWTKKIKNYLN